MIWIQVRDLRAGHARLAAAGVPVSREPVTEPWGLTEMWIQDPDGVQIVLVEVPAAHSLRRDPRPDPPPRRRNLHGGVGIYPGRLQPSASYPVRSNQISHA